jgi:hypothetical protein
MTVQDVPSGRRKPSTIPATVEEAPEVKQAVAKAQEYARLAAAARNPEKRDYYLRMERKWVGIADGWRVIVEIDRPH